MKGLKEDSQKEAECLANAEPKRAKPRPFCSILKIDSSLSVAEDSLNES